jgi:23S rRNA (guanosine2251-2'-O)-methyltransferase
MILYGRNAVREALRGRRAVIEVVTNERSRDLAWLAAVAVRVVDTSELVRLAGSDDHQGVVARVAAYRYVDADTLLDAQAPLIVALDELTDPQNLGAIARSVDGAGATGIVIPRHRSVAVTAAVCRASAGAVEHLSIGIVPNLADWLIRAKRPGIWVYGLDQDAAEPYTQMDLRGGVVLVVGSEGRGLRPRVRASLDAAMRIPLAGTVGSLNASVATAVVLFEARRQRSL